MGLLTGHVYVERGTKSYIASEVREVVIFNQMAPDSAPQ